MNLNKWIKGGRERVEAEGVRGVQVYNVNGFIDAMRIRYVLEVNEPDNNEIIKLMDVWVWVWVFIESSLAFVKFLLYLLNCAISLVLI